MKKLFFFLLTVGVCFTACKKDSVEQSRFSHLVAVAEDPYSGPLPSTSNVFYLVQKEITQGNSGSVNRIYINRRNGQPYSDEMKVYYSTTPEFITIKFGTTILKNIVEFKTGLNQTIREQGYAILVSTNAGDSLKENWQIIL